MEDKKIYEALSSLPRGFRFHPTNQELLNHYLKPKSRGRPGEHDIIPEIDACKLKPDQFEQWPAKYGHKFNSKKPFYFCRLKKYKHSNSECCYDRKTIPDDGETSGGFWKVNRADRPIMSEDPNPEKIGFVKELEFRRGNSAKNESFNWVCHEYHLNHNEDEKSEPYVLCRIEKKKKEKKPIAALAPTISPVGCSSGPHASTRNVSGTPVNQEGDHPSFRNTLNNGVAGNQEAINAQPETSAEELMDFMNSLPPIPGPDEISPDYNNILTYQPHAEAGDGPLFFPGFSYDNLPCPYEDPAKHPSFGTSTDHYNHGSPSTPGWESGTV